MSSYQKKIEGLSVSISEGCFGNKSRISTSHFDFCTCKSAGVSQDAARIYQNSYIRYISYLVALMLKCYGSFYNYLE